MKREVRYFKLKERENGKVDCKEVTKQEVLNLLKGELEEKDWVYLEANDWKEARETFNSWMHPDKEIIRVWDELDKDDGIYESIKENE